MQGYADKLSYMADFIIISGYRGYLPNISYYIQTVTTSFIFNQDISIRWDMIFLIIANWKFLLFHE